MKKFTSAALALIAMALPAMADEAYYVSPEGNNTNDGKSEATAFRSITKAVNLLADNTPTTIYLAQGATFDVSGPEAIIVGENKNVKFVGDGTVLKSGDKEYLGDRIAYINKGTDASFYGLTFKNGCVRDGQPGGAIFFDGNVLEVSHCTFTKNEGNNSAGAIASRGKDVIITDCIFDANRVFGGYGCGAVIYHCGLPNAPREKCSLIIRNSSFTNNESKSDTKGDLIGFLQYCRGSEYTHEYSNVTYFEMSNCLVKGNIAGSPSANVRPRGTDIYIGGVRDDMEINLINNTFYNTKVLAFRSFFDVPYRLINNVFYKKVEGDERNDFAILSENDSEDRDELIAYNNCFVCDFSKNLHIDDACFTSKRDECGNIILDADQSAQLGFDKRTSTDGSYAEYLPITNASSVLIDKGLDSTEGKDGCDGELIPATDITGKKPVGRKDIGCFEYGEGDGVAAAEVADNIFALATNGTSVRVSNLGGQNMHLTVTLIDGRTIYTADSDSDITIARDELSMPSGILIFTATAAGHTQTVKTVIPW